MELGVRFSAPGKCFSRDAAVNFVGALEQSSAVMAMSHNVPVLGYSQKRRSPDFHENIASPWPPRGPLRALFAHRRPRLAYRPATRMIALRRRVTTGLIASPNVGEPMLVSDASQ